MERRQPRETAVVADGPLVVGSLVFRVCSPFKTQKERKGAVNCRVIREIGIRTTQEEQEGASLEARGGGIITGSQLLILIGQILSMASRPLKKTKKMFFFPFFHKRV